MGRLTKAKSEATTRARTAVENEFITQGVASVDRENVMNIIKTTVIKYLK